MACTSKKQLLQVLDGVLPSLVSLHHAELYLFDLKAQLTQHIREGQTLDLTQLPEHERLLNGEVVQTAQATYFPLESLQAIMGTLVIHTRDEDALPPLECEILQDVAFHIAIVLESLADVLRRAEHLARSTLNALSAHVAILDENGTIIAVNDAWRDFAQSNGADPSTVSEGINYLEVCDNTAVMGNADSAVFARGIRQVLQPDEVGEFSYEYPCHSPEEKRWFVAKITRFDAQDTQRLVIAHENVTRLKQIENAEREQRALAEALLDTTTALNSTLDLDEVMERLLLNLKQIVPHEDASIVLCEENNEMRVIAHTGVAKVADNAFLTQMLITREPVIAHQDKQNTEHDRTYIGAPIINDAVIGFISLSVTDDSDAVQAAASHLQAFADHAAIAIQNAQHYNQAQELAMLEERQRLAKELHDSVSQTLFSANIMAQSLPKLWEKNEVRAQRVIEDLHELTSGAQAEMRMLLMELRPSTLSGIALDQLLSQLATGFTGRSRIQVDVSLQEIPAVSFDVKLVFYRIAQEALNNISRHSEAERVIISLEYSENRVSLLIKDNGRGFTLRDDRHIHHGLKIMEERAESVNAILDISSKIDSGTCVTIQWYKPDDN